jgi:Bacterial Ig-like domain (group 1)
MTPRNTAPNRAKRSLLHPQLFHGAGKWVTALVTTGAAILALLVNAQNLGLGAWLGAHGLGFADYAASRVVVTPRVDTLFAIGDTLPMAATVTDRRGAALVGSSLTWHTEDSSVATADSDGTVVARGPGTARVVARVRGLTAEARITVRQRVERVAISGDTVVRLPEGEGVQLVASALDARGFRVHDRMPRWTSGDSTVASVDSAGSVMAHVPGRTVLTAALGDFTARASVEVVLSPARLILESGDAQRVPAGRRVPQPIVVRVLSRSGRPVPGVAVAFRADDPDASLSPPVDTTDRVGKARTTWTLAPRPGRQHLAASVDGVDSALVVAVEADPVARNTRVALAGEAPNGRAGATLDQPVAVLVTDSTGAALAGVPVIWDPLDGGRLEPLADRTDSAGEARTRWTLGARAGAQRAQVRVGNPRTMPPFVITASAAAGDPQAVTLLAGDGQTGHVGAALPHDIVLGVNDRYGNPVPHVAVQARPRDGTVADTMLETDAAGRVTIRWTLGRRAGADLLRVRARGVDSLLTVIARARALPAANVTFVKPIAAGARGRALVLTVAASDGYGNPAPDALVVFSVSAGTLSATRVMTDANGQASTHWTPGTAAEQTITAVVRGTPARATHIVRVAPKTSAGGPRGAGHA